MGQKPLQYPKCMEQDRMDLDAIEKLVQRKIEQRAPRPEVQMQCAFKMFGSPKDGLTLDMFKTQLWRMGVPVNVKEALGLFKRYDKDGGGVIDFYEFIQGVMPNDYPTKAWTQQRDEDQARDVGAHVVVVVRHPCARGPCRANADVGTGAGVGVGAGPSGVRQGLRLRASAVGCARRRGTGNGLGVAHSRRHPRGARGRQRACIRGRGGRRGRGRCRPWSSVVVCCAVDPCV